MNKFSQEQRDIAAQIGQFYLKKNLNNYTAANYEIERVRFNRIEVMPDGWVEIEVSRPGRLIGKRGENIEGLQKHLGRNLRIKETEQHIADYIYVHEPEEEYPF